MGRGIAKTLDSEGWGALEAAMVGGEDMMADSGLGFCRSLKEGGWYEEALCCESGRGWQFGLLAWELRDVA